MDLVSWYAVFLFSVTFHEAAHAYFLYKLGDKTAYLYGQVTLNPIPHIKREPLGMVVVPLLSYVLYGWMFGWASAPYDMLWALRNPKKSALSSAAGPFANFLLFFVSALLLKIGLFFKIFTVPGAISVSRIVAPSNPGIFYPVSVLLSIMFTLNIVLFVFNMIPLPPLDGFGIISAFLNEETYRKYYTLFTSNPWFSLLGLFIAWNVFGVVFYPFFKMMLIFVYFGF